MTGDPLDPATGPVLALDIGGTKLEAGVVDPGGRIRGRRRSATEGAGADDLFSLVLDICGSALAEEAVEGPAPVALGVGCGGPMTAGGATVSPLNIGQWRGFPLRDRLQEHLGLRTWVDNDAKALTLAEGRWGAAVGVSDHMSLVVSTGVGGGIVVDGRLLDGADANAGHLGHVVVDPRGRRCVCGGRGCLEAMVSGRSIEAITGAPAAEAPTEVRRWAGRLVGRAVGSVCNLLDLRLATVAGSVALGFGEPFFAAAQGELDRVCRLGFSRGARIVPAGCGADGPLLGAAAVALRALERDR